MDITFLGTNGWYDTATGNTVSVLVRSQDYDIVFDAGNGLAKLPRYCSGEKPVYLFLSHLHLDHIIGLHTLVKQKFSKGLYIVLLQENRASLEAFLDQPYTLSLPRLPFAVTIIEAPQQLAQLPFAVQVLPMMHPDPTMGVRLVLDGQTIVFSGDTGLCDNLYTLAQNADVLITECAFRPGETSTAWPHLNPESAATLAKAVQAKQLFLTHFDASRYETLTERAVAEKVARQIFAKTVASTDDLQVTL